MMQTGKRKLVFISLSDVYLPKKKRNPAKVFDVDACARGAIIVES